MTQCDVDCLLFSYGACVGACSDKQTRIGFVCVDNEAKQCDGQLILAGNTCVTLGN